MRKILEIAKRINELGGSTYYVGGFVRDRLLDIDNSDVDVEVHGIEANKLKEILSDYSNKLEYKESFGIFTLKDENIDIALPRTEIKIGEKHCDFKIEVNPFLGTYEAALRRDFTMNALYQNVLTDEIIDHFGGVNDINNRVIRVVNEKTFKDDPLRVLRAAQFAARFEFSVEPKTLELCRGVDLTTLSKSRVSMELDKALYGAIKPSIFFDVLNEMNQLDYWFKEVKALQNTSDNLYQKTMNRLDETLKYEKHISDMRDFRYLCLTGDMSKINQNSVYDFITRITDSEFLIDYVVKMNPLLTLPSIAYKENASLEQTNNIFDKAADYFDLVFYTPCDEGIKDEHYLHFMMDRLNKYVAILKEPCVTGKDLIEAGIEEGPDYKRALEYAHKLQLAGIPKQEALSKILISLKNELLS